MAVVDHQLVCGVSCDCFWTKFSEGRSAGLAAGESVLGIREREVRVAADPVPLKWRFPYENW
jgi:hypothetical protein